MTPETARLILKLLRLVTFGLTSVELRLELQRVNDELATMVAENRGPTGDELFALEQRLDNAHHALSL